LFIAGFIASSDPLEAPHTAFPTRHRQLIEAGRPITLTTLLRICEALDVRLITMVEGLDRGSKS